MSYHAYVRRLKCIDDATNTDYWSALDVKDIDAALDVLDRRKRLRMMARRLFEKSRRRKS